MNKLFNFFRVAVLATLVLGMSVVTFAQMDHHDHSGDPKGNKMETAILDVFIPEILDLKITEGAEVWCVLESDDDDDLKKYLREGRICGETKLKVCATCPWTLKCDAKYDEDASQVKEGFTRGPEIIDCIAARVKSNDCPGKLRDGMGGLLPANYNLAWMSFEDKMGTLNDTDDDMDLVRSHDINNLCVEALICVQYGIGPVVGGQSLVDKMFPAGSYFINIKYSLCPFGAGVPG